MEVGKIKKSELSLAEIRASLNKLDEQDGQKDGQIVKCNLSCFLNEDAAGESDEDTTISIQEALRLVFEKQFGKDKNFEEEVKKEIDSLTKQRDKIDADIKKLKAEFKDSLRNKVDPEINDDMNSARNIQSEDTRSSINSSLEEFKSKNANSIKSGFEKHIKIIKLEFELTNIQNQIDEMKKCIE